ncbi:MAG: hypothetical protein ACI4MQ_01275 [Candidatus Coproplasma sp.]
MNNLVFIILMSILFLGNIFKVVFTFINKPETARTVILVVVWIIELCITTALLSLLYYANGFDLQDFFQFFATCFILILCIAEVIEFIKFLNALISSEN